MQYKLSEIFDLQMGKTPDRHNPEFWSNGVEPWISIADLSKCGHYIKETKECISEKAVQESGIKLIPPNTVVMSFKLSIGKTAITLFPMYSNEAIMAFIDKGIIDIDPVYLYYLLSSRDWDQGTNKAVMGKTLNKATLSQIMINVHDFKKQKEIICVLNAVDAVLNTRQQQLDKLDQLVKSQFIEMFGDVISNDKLWPQSKLGDKADIGSSKRIFAREYVKTGVPFYRSKEIIELGNHQKPSVELFISQQRYQEIKDRFGVPQKGDILMTAVGTIGKFWTVDTDNPFYYKDGNLVYIRTNQFNSAFFRKLLEALIDDYKQEFANGSAYAALPIEKLKNMGIVIPPIELQNRYGYIVEQADKSKFELQQAIDDLTVLMKSIIQQNLS